MKLIPNSELILKFSFLTNDDRPATGSGLFGSQNVPILPGLLALTYSQ